MNIKNMSLPEILNFQDKLEKELSYRTDNLYSTLSAITKIEEKQKKVVGFYLKKIQDLKNKNQELQELEKLGFSAFLYSSSGHIELINYAKNNKPDLYYGDRKNSYYGCELNYEKKEILVKDEKFFIEPTDMTKIKQILKII